MRYVPKKQKLYRSRHGLCLGVCAGVSQYVGVSSFWIRLGFIALFMMTGFWPMVLLYVVAAILMEPSPAMALESDETAEFYGSYVHDRRRALRRLKRMSAELDRRVRRIEDIVTSKDYLWESKIG